MGSGEGCGEGCATVGGKRTEEMVRRIDAKEPQANEEAGKERAEEMVRMGSVLINKQSFIVSYAAQVHVLSVMYIQL